MHKIDCANIPTEVTDFAFDQVHDEYDSSKMISIDYDSQVVYIPEESTDFVTNVKNTIQDYCSEKINDMLFELQNGFDTELTEKELRLAKSNISYIIVEEFEE